MSTRKSLIGLYDALEGIPKTAAGYQAIQSRPNAGDLVYTAPGTLLSTSPVHGFDTWMFGDMSPEACNERYARLVLFLPCRMTSPEMDNGWNAETYRWVTDFIRRLKIPVISAAESVLTNSNDYHGDFHRRLPAHIVDYLRALSERCVCIGARGEFSAQVIRDLGIDNVEPVGCASLLVNGPALPARLLQRRPFEELQRIALGYTNNVYGEGSLIGQMLRVAADHGHYFIEQQFSLLTKLLYWPQTLIPGDLQRGRALYQGLDQVNRLLQQRQVRYFTHYGQWNRFCQGLDFMYGSRLHGGVMAINAGVPSYFISQDARLREVCEFYRLPWTDERDVRARGIDVRRFHEQADYSDACRIYPQRYQHYLDFLRRNGIEPSLDAQARARMDLPPPAPGVGDECDGGELLQPATLAALERILGDADAGRPATTAQLAQFGQAAQLSRPTPPSMSLANPTIRYDIQRIAARLPDLDGLRGRHLLLTGGTGFFGKWLLALCDWLHEQGWNLQVTVISRDPERFLRAQPHYRQRPWLRWLGADILSLPQTALQADLLLHAATDSSVAGQADRLALLHTLYEGTRQVLELALRSGVRRVLLTGSGAQYGNAPHDNAWNESDPHACSSHEARHVYGEGKRVQEMLGALYAERYGLEVVHTRGFAFAGPGLPLDAHFAIGNFVRDALQRDAIILDSAGQAIRSYLHGADLAAWLLCLLVDGTPGEVYNVGSDEALSIAELAKRVGARLAPDKPVRIMGALGGTCSHYVPDISKARALGLDVWTPLDAAIDSMGRWAASGRAAGEAVAADHGSSIGSTCVTDWASIAGGRCQGAAWRVGIAGFSLTEQQAFVLDDASWADLQQQLPFAALGCYGDANGLALQRMADARCEPFDALLLLAHERRDQPLLQPGAQQRRYLHLRSAAERARVPDETSFARLFIPAGQPFSDERLVYVSQFVDTSGWPAHLPHAAPAGQHGEADYPNTYYGSTDFWINALSAAMAADAATVRDTAPLLSVIIPAYNYGRFLGQCVQSVLDQGVDSIEILVLDNASTDETPEVMAAFADEPRVRYLRNRHNCGAGHNWRNGLWIAQGRYFTFLSADDYFNEGHLARLLSVLESHPQVAVGYTSIRWVNDQGQALNQRRHPGYRDSDYVGGRNEVADLLIHDCYMTPSAVIHRRTAFRSTWQPGHTMGGSDWEMVIQMAERYPDFAYVDTPGVSYRWHGAQDSNRFYASTAPLQDHLTIVEGVLERRGAAHLQGRELEVAAHLQRRLALYPRERDSTLGQRANALVERLEALASSSDAPFFSIILTTFDRPALLQDALASVAAQRFRDFEVILVNDHGVPVEHLLQDVDFPATYLRLGRNQGISVARNAALALARGRYIAYLDDDDIYLPQHLGIVAQACLQAPDAVIYTEAEYVRERLESGKRIELGRNRPFRHKDFDAERLHIANYIPVNSWVHPRAALDATGGFDPALSSYEDWDMLLRLAARHRFVHLGDVTVEVRMRDAGAGNDHLQRREAGHFPALMRKIHQRYPGTGSDTLLQGRRRALESLRSTSGTPSVEQWLAARGLSGWQARLLEDHLAAAGATASISILIRCSHDASAALLRQTLDSLAAQHMLTCRPELFVIGGADCADDGSAAAGVTRIASGQDEVAALNQAIAQSSGEWLLIVEAGETFTVAGLATVLAQAADAGAVRALFADTMMRQNDGEPSALLRPDFNLDMLLSMPSAMARHWLFRRSEFLALGGLRAETAEAAEFDLILRMIDEGGIAGLGHVHEPLLVVPAQALSTSPHEIDAITRHLRNRGYAHARVEATQPGLYRVDYGHEATPGVSIIIPSRNAFALLSRCVEGLLDRTRYRNIEVLIVDNGSDEAAAVAWLDGIAALDDPQLRVLRHPGEFNFAAMNNLAAAQARGEYLLLLNNDTAVLREDWLDAMLNHAQRPEVGIVGAKLLYPDGRVQHAGLLPTQPGWAEQHAFAGAQANAPGYMHRLQIDQNYSAVSGACLMVRRSIYEELGGLDATSFTVSCGDIDLCMKARAAGYLVVWTPHAVLMHEGGASRVRIDTRDVDVKAQQFSTELDTLYDRWLPEIANDPAYNTNLAVTGPAFRVETESALNWHPLSWRPMPVALVSPADQAGCGHYRIIQPGNAMGGFGLAEVANSPRYLTPVEMERLSPDVAVFQRQMTADKIPLQQRVARFSRCFKVAELDDYLPNVPRKSLHHGMLPKDILRTMREALKLMDRFVVSTPALAEALGGLHPDIRVVENHLPLHWWGELSSRRRQGRKPRVGWGGGSGHAGDLALIADVVKTLADQVEWVFFGMCPADIRPYVHEFHAGVAIEQYPAKLASLNLDLALAPLEDNLFNRCKSPLRLLEYGACGYPVICSDLPNYRDSGLPVTSVRPRFKDWVDAIRMHLDDADASARAGDALRAAVHRDWMLDEAHARLWLSRWMPD